VLVIGGPPEQSTPRPDTGLLYVASLGRKGDIYFQSLIYENCMGGWIGEVSVRQGACSHERLPRRRKELCHSFSGMSDWRGFSSATLLQWCMTDLNPQLVDTTRVSRAGARLQSLLVAPWPMVGPVRAMIRGQLERAKGSFP
jgi:hypothetical protein